MFLLQIYVLVQPEDNVFQGADITLNQLKCKFQTIIVS